MVRDILIWPDPILKQQRRPRRQGRRRHPSPARRHVRDHVRRRRRRPRRAAGRRAEALHRHRHLAPAGGAEAHPPGEPARSSGPRGRPPTPRAASPSPARPRTWTASPRSGCGRSTTPARRSRSRPRTCSPSPSSTRHDHLEGTVFVDHLSSLKRELIRRRMKKLKAEHASETPGEVKKAAAAPVGAVARRAGARSRHPHLRAEPRHHAARRSRACGRGRSRRPCQTSSWWAMPQRSGGRSADSSSSTRSGFGLPREAEPAREPPDVGVDREGVPGAEVHEDDAGGLAPHAGQRLERLAGSGAPRRRARPTMTRAAATMAFALLRKSPRRADVGPERPRAGRRRRRPRRGRRRRAPGVTWFTRTSGHWAERITATSSSQVGAEVELDARAGHGLLEPVDHLPRAVALRHGRRC